MRIKKFIEYNESIIIPNKMELEGDIDIKALEDFAKKNGIKFINSNLIKNTKKNPKPPNFPKGPPFYSFFDPKTKKITFVINNNYNIIPSKKEFLAIIGHENIHKQQDEKNPLPSANYKDEKSYFSNKYEIMAFAWSIASDINLNGLPIEKNIKYLNDNRLWYKIKSVVDNSVKNKYLKYIYLYLEYLKSNPQKDYDNERKLKLHHTKEKY